MSSELEDISPSPKFAAAIVKMQSEIEGAKKGKANPAFRSKYADLGACWDACRDALQANGLALLQPLTKASPGHVGVATMLVYGPTGEVMVSVAEIPVKDPTNAQALGSAVTYGRRYGLCAMIGICPEDDDGNAASGASRGSGVAVRSNASSVSTETWLNRFNACSTQESMKDLYNEAKFASIPEPGKSQMLTDWATRIKGAK